MKKSVDFVKLQNFSSRGLLGCNAV